VTDASLTVLSRRRRHLAGFARANGRVVVQRAIQYRSSALLMIVALLSEPLVYLVVWRTVADENGGSVEGFTPGRFAAYYIVWTLIRQMMLMGSPYDWEIGIRRGDLSFQLLRPLHPINQPLSAMPAWGVVLVLIWLPIGAVLTLAFQPELHTSPLQVIAFVVAVVFAGVISVLTNAALGMTAFWFTRITAVVNLVWTSNLLLSGRLVPVALLPEWARWISSLLWFRWVWDFPIIVLIGPIDTSDIAIGLAMQVVWIAIGAAVVRTMWHRGVRRYGAVGG